MSKQILIKLFVTDLDNTLYDWVSSQVPAFYAMVEVAVRTLRVNQAQLLDELKAVHQRYHSAEQPFALIDTPLVVNHYPGLTRLERLKHLTEAFETYYKVREQNLRLFPSVRNTLQEIQRSCCLIVGYTEAVLDNSLYRMKRLHLFDYLNALYAPRDLGEGHPDPTQRNIHAQYENKVRFVPEGHRKPDPSVLEAICSVYKVAPQQTLYVGDHLLRDIAMAKQAGVWATWVNYDYKYNPDDWRRLVCVSHLTDVEIESEKQLKQKFKGLRPDRTIKSYAELLKYFKFAAL